MRMYSLRMCLRNSFHSNHFKVKVILSNSFRKEEENNKIIPLTFVT